MSNDKEIVRQAVVFSILMEGNLGILGKAPSYVLEKWYSVQRCDQPERLLDAQNMAKFEKWQKIWCG